MAPHFLRFTRRLAIAVCVGFLALFLVRLKSSEREPAHSSAPDAAAETAARIAALRAEIARHDELYFKQAAPIITDAAYDQLKRELAALERTMTGLTGEGISLVAEDDRSGLFPTGHHQRRMLSLNKCHTASDLRGFLGRVGLELGREDLTYVIEPKYDGVAIEVTYEKGKLVRAVTRGNGSEGDEVTANVMTIANLPHRLRPWSDAGSTNLIPDLIELRGEIYLTFAEFDRINRQREEWAEPAFANPRNLAAGTLKSLDPATVAGRRLEIVFYGVGEVAPVEASPASQQHLHALIHAWGLPGVGKYSTADNADEVCAKVAAVGRERGRLPFPIDGAVVKLDSVRLQRQLGEGIQAPNWAIAYKFAPQAAESKVKAISIQIGRTGVLTPVAEFDAVQLGGSKVRKASLHNREEIVRRDIRVGDYVSVEKAGDVIPVIASVNLRRRPEGLEPFNFPEACPACGTTLVQVAGEVAVRCPNYDCDAQIKRRLEHFVSQAGVAIAGLGPAAVERLVNWAGVRTFADLYRLRREDLIDAGLGAPKSADRLLAAIQQSRQAQPWRFINGFGIPQVGAATARQLARKFSSWESLLGASDGQLREAGINPAAAAAIREFFQRKEPRDAVLALVSEGIPLLD